MFLERGVADAKEKDGVEALLGGERFCPTSSDKMTDIENGFLGLSISPKAPPPPPPGGFGGV